MTGAWRPAPSPPPAVRRRKTGAARHLGRGEQKKKTATRQPPSASLQSPTPRASTPRAAATIPNAAATLAATAARAPATHDRAHGKQFRQRPHARRRGSTPDRHRPCRRDRRVAAVEAGHADGGDVAAHSRDDRVGGASATRRQLRLEGGGDDYHHPPRRRRPGPPRHSRHRPCRCRCHGRNRLRRRQRRPFSPPPWPAITSATTTSAQPATPASAWWVARGDADGVGEACGESSTPPGQPPPPAATTPGHTATACRGQPGQNGRLVADRHRRRTTAGRGRRLHRAVTNSCHGAGWCRRPRRSWGGQRGGIGPPGSAPPLRPQRNHFPHRRKPPAPPHPQRPARRRPPPPPYCRRPWPSPTPSHHQRLLRSRRGGQRRRSRARGGVQREEIGPPPRPAPPPRRHGNHHHHSRRPPPPPCPPRPAHRRPPPQPRHGRWSLPPPPRRRHPPAV